jgi:hypothetical protein
MLLCISDYSEIAVNPLFHFPTGESPLIFPMDRFQVFLFILSIYCPLNLGKKFFIILIAAWLEKTSLLKAAIDLFVRTALRCTIVFLEASLDIVLVVITLGLVTVVIIGISFPVHDKALGYLDYIFLVCSTHEGS